MSIGRMGGEYRVALHDAQGVPVADLHIGSTDSLKWGRSLSEVSAAGVTANPADAELVVSRVRPWVTWMSVWRAEEFVWTGPVSQMAIRRAGLAIGAKDPMTFAWRTRSQLSRVWSDADPVAVAADVWESMVSWHGLGKLPGARTVPSTLSYGFESQRDRRMTNQLFDDLVQLGIEYTVVGGQALFLPSLRAPEVVAGARQLSDADFDTELEAVHDGTRLFNDIRLQGKNWASTQAREVAGLRLQNLLSIDELFGQADIERAARQAVARSAAPRAALRVPAGAGLSVDAPILVRELVPGLVLPVWTDLAGGLRDFLRLESVEVTVSGGREKVAVTLGESPVENDPLAPRSGGM